MRTPALLLFLIAPGLLAGCGGGSAPLPSTPLARQALQTSLDAWKAGKPASSLTNEKPGIEAVDFEWKSGKVLSEYTLGEEIPGQGTQTVSVSLTLQGEPAAKTVQYMILGLDPVRIFRDEDYNRAMNMDNAPTPTKTER
jgi:hypothetical protein